MFEAIATGQRIAQGCVGGQCLRDLRALTLQGSFVAKSVGATYQVARKSLARTELRSSWLASKSQEME